MEELFIGIFEPLCELLAELFIEVIGELLGDALFNSVSDDTPPKQVVRFLIYAALGIGIGFVSVWLLPHNFLKSAPLRAFGLIVNPLIAGLGLFWLKRRGATNGARQYSLGNLINGWVIVFAIALIRFVYTS